MDMDYTALKQLVDAHVNDFLWWVLGIGMVLFFKNAIENFVWGLTFLLDKDYNVDDEVLIGGTRKARIVRQTITKTVFYLYDHNSRLVIPNKELHSLRCEKVLSGTKIKNEEGNP